MSPSSESSIQPDTPSSTPLEISSSSSNGESIVAKTSNIKKIEVKNITSLDCRILQYQYAITKLEVFIKSLKSLSSKCAIEVPSPTASLTSSSSTNQATTPMEPNGSIESISTKPELKFESLPLLQFIVLLTGNVFAISDSSFNAKLELLSNFKLFKSTPVNITTTTTHISYDTPDTHMTALNELPKISLALKCLKALEILSGHCLQGYRKRLAQAKIEQQKLYGIDRSDYYTVLERIIQDEIFNAKEDIDLNFSNVIFDLPKDSTLLQNENFVEGSLIDMDIKMLFLINTQLKSTLNDKLKPLITQLKTLKHTPNKAVDKFSLHKIFLLTLRLNEMYTIFRKVGRKIYLSNQDHLTDSRFLLQLKNANYFKSHYLTNLNDMLNSMKKNGTLIANLTRLIRQDSQFEVNIKNVNDLINFVNQGFVMLDGSLEKVISFGREWITSELRFRKTYQLPKKNLFDVYQMFHEGGIPQINITSATGRSLVASQKANGVSSNELEAFPSTNKTGLEKGLKKLEIGEKTVTRGSRSSSISSIGSNGSNNSKPLLRKNSLTSPSRNAFLTTQAAAGTPTSSPIRARPNSQIFLNHNSSLSNIESNGNDASNASTTSVIGRRRSNSQPIKSASTLLDEKIATSGAAAALTRNGSISSNSSNNSLRSPSGSINRKPVQPTLNTIKNSAISPTPVNNKNKKLLVVEEEEDSQSSKSSPKLSANQRLQQHIRQAAKSGSMMTQQKEILTSVTFDPNTPSATPIRRYIDVPIKETPSPEPLSSSPPLVLNTVVATTNTIASPKPKRTRDQVTRLNTQRNSVTPQLPEEGGEVPLSKSPSSSTLSSSNNSSSNSTLKKVRFTGVAEYTAEEDAPTKYSHAILRNFAMFRNPIKVNVKHSSPSTFKKKDQLLKKEESISFKKQVHNPIDEEIISDAPPPPQPSALAHAQIAAARSNGISKSV
ncbi:hypothetical protein DFJ63DRAFT_323642 [Scheffersomyces coipomensis]|uniref:uncharacterized protein n=1 Tax=Scheffersomyces coipomensis TaxID=1788519 RepID=UPI00315CB117